MDMYVVLTFMAEQLAKVSEVIANEINQISNSPDLVMKKIGGAYQVIRSIQNIANHSKILGLNASIEAARAGDYGSGFSIVAKEVGKMADQSKESAVNIIEYLGNVTTAVDKNNNSIQEIGATAEELMNSIKLESVSDVIVREKPL